MKRLSYICCLVLLLCLVGGCRKADLPPTEIHQELDLAIVFPHASTELAGGQSIRVTAVLQDQNGEPVEGVDVEAELWSPDGKMYARIPCHDQKVGRYLSDHISLPTRDSSGLWRITIQAVTKDGEISEADGEFIGLNSYSERLQELFGFWIELTDLLPYNVAGAEDPLLKTYDYEDGGYVILANNITTTQFSNTFVILDVHWRQNDFPENADGATEYVLQLAGPHRISLDISPADLEVERDTFLESPAWHVTGSWIQNNALGEPRPPSPLDWILFQCPGSDTIWTILVTTNDINYLADLKAIRGSFKCSRD